MNSRHVPIRTCIACGKKLSFHELVRIVRTPEGTVRIDGNKRTMGRGAYMCINENCWDTALNKGSLDRALRVDVISRSQLSVQQIRAQIELRGRQGV